MNKTLAQSVARIIKAHDENWTTEVLGGYKIGKLKVTASVFATHTKTGNLYYLGSAECLEGWFRVHKSW